MKKKIITRKERELKKDKRKEIMLYILLGLLLSGMVLTFLIQ